MKVLLPRNSMSRKYTAPLRLTSFTVLKIIINEYNELPHLKTFVLFRKKQQNS